ncbi:MAG: C13 family peptidase [Algisphaera sp.]
MPALTVQETAGDLADAAATPPYTTESFNPHTRVFLFAASADVANFAQETIDQRNTWVARGVAPHQIACYHARPTRKAYLKDAAQYNALRNDLAAFYPATLSTLRRHLNAAAATPPAHVYLYFTGHGQRPGSARMSLAQRKHPQTRALFARIPGLNQHRLTNNALDTGTANLRMKLHAVSHGTPEHDVFLTPTALHDMLAVFPPSTRKTVVLQGCYTGGFSPALARVPNLTLLTAAQADRPSFGCAAGNRVTVFGQCFADALAHQPGRPSNIDWSALHTKLIRTVEARETAMDIALPRRSHPTLTHFP